MKFWTIQHVEAWNTSLKNGFIEGNTQFICDERFRAPYEWLKGQMSNRLPNYKKEQPIWLWLDKPDMRTSGHAEKGSKIVRIGLELNPNNVLLSDFERWHSILNSEYCINNEKEERLIEKNLFEKSKEETWLRIFDKPNAESFDYWGSEDEQVLQGTTGKILLKDVVSVEHFLAK